MKKKLLYLTDLSYPAKGRRYCDEDIYVTDRLSERFDVALCHPRCSESFEKDADLIVFRNTGAVAGFKDVYDAFVRRVRREGFRTFNEFTGRADMCGKQYLVDLTAAGYPVIPTVESLAALDILPETEKYCVKPKDGADSIGLAFLTREELIKSAPEDGTMLIQPAVDFTYEVSFYFLNDRLEYALYAPDKSRRWQLARYEPMEADVRFAGRFIRWNGIKNGIQRVDACRTREGELLLVELEDLNPYLSLSELDDKTRDRFMADWMDALERML